MSEKIKKILGFLKKWLLLWLPLFMLDSLPVISAWLANKEQVTIYDLTFPLILSLILSLVVSLIFLYVQTKNRLAAFCGSICAIILLGQKYSSHYLNFLNHLKTSGENYFVLGFFLATIILTLAVSYAIYKLSRKWQLKTDILANAGLIVIAVAFLFKLIPLVNLVIQEWPQFFYRPPAIQQQPTVSPSASQPDIYYIILDRYASQSVLQNQFNFDNSAFTKFLTDNNFYVNPTADSNYPYTTMSIASTLNASYLNDLTQKFGQAASQTLQPFHDAIHYSSVIQKLKSIGYTYYHLGSWYEATNQSPLADVIYQDDGRLVAFNHVYYLSDFTKKLLSPSIFYIPLQAGFKIANTTVYRYRSPGPKAATLTKIQVLNQLAESAPGNRFIFAHLIIPHDPYFFNADGSLSKNPGSNNNGRPVQQKYLDQLTFITNQIKEIIDKIDAHSNNQAIILLQSDEGPYPMEFSGGGLSSKEINSEITHDDMRQWSDNDLKMKYGILAAYKLPNATKDDIAAHGDSVNIFRLVFNTYFNGGVPYLPKCYYAYPDGRQKPFVFADITARLTGQANPACE